MKVCFFVNNLYDNKPRTKLEAEFELFDRKKDVIIDLINLGIAQPNEVLIYPKEYKIRFLPRAKEYYVRAGLFEQGKLFTKGYRVAKTYNEVDLSEINIYELGFRSVWKDMKQFFKRGKK